MVKIYTTATCPKCRILKTKMSEKNVEYVEETSLDVMTALNITSVPQLQIDDGPLMDFVAANNWVNSLEG